MGVLETRPLKPNQEPEFASDTNYTGGPLIGFPTKAEPTAAEKQQGFEPGEEPPAQKFNWQRNLVYRWSQYWNAFPAGIVGHGRYSGFVVEHSGGGVFSVNRQEPFVPFDHEGSFATVSNNGGNAQINAPGSDMDNGDEVTISGSASYDGTWTVIRVDNDAFVINTPFLATDAGDYEKVKEGFGYFIMRDGTKLSVNQDYADFNAASPASASVGSIRYDAVLIDYDPEDTTPTVAFEYVEDIFTNQVTKSDIVAIIVVADNAAFTVDRIIKNPNQYGHRYRIGIGDGVRADNVDSIRLDQLQDVIDELNFMGGGVIEIIGQDFGAHIPTEIKLKSKVELVGVGNAHLKAEAGDSHLIQMEGSANTIGSGNVDTDGTLTDSFADFQDYGIGSRVVFTSGLNSGVVGIVSDYVSGGVQLLDEYMEPLTTAIDPTVNYEIYISHSKIDNLNLCGNTATFHIVRCSYTYDCGVENCHFINDGSIALGGAIIWSGKNDRFKLRKCTLPDGSGFDPFSALKIDSIIANNTDWDVEHNYFDTDTFVAGGNGFSGNYSDNTVTGTDKWAFLGTCGWTGTIETNEHNIDGTHKGLLSGRNCLSYSLSADQPLVLAGPLVVLFDNLLTQSGTALSYNPATGIFTVSIPAFSTLRARISATMTIRGNNWNVNTRALLLLHVGNEYYYLDRIYKEVAGADGITVGGSAVIGLNNGDTFTIEIDQDSGAVQNVAGDITGPPDYKFSWVSVEEV